MRIACIGGGPGGLFAAILLKTANPAREVTVFERNRAEDTFGFGVVFSDATLTGINAADPVLGAALTNHGSYWDHIEVRVKGERLRYGGNGMAAVERKTLLHLMQRKAIDVGVDVRFSTTVQSDALVDAGYDLVIASDGANSGLREKFQDVFEPSVETASAKFIWFGSTYAFDGLTFVHERAPQGVFAAHTYPIGNGTSTFVVETDEASWLAAGLDEFDVTQPPGKSDERSRLYLEELFSDQIEGHQLLANNSRWGNFRTRRARRWRHRQGSTAFALLGDAAHTAHFSVGSGTKMAMEDAVALASALDQHGSDIDAALAQYESVRLPQVTKIQDAARPSLAWWEHFGRSYDAFPPWQFAYNFFTRSISDSKLRRRDEKIVSDVHASWNAQHGAEPLNTPIELAGQRLPGRVVSIVDGAVQLPLGTLPLAAQPPGEGLPWGLLVQAPVDETALASTWKTVTEGIAAGASLVAITGGTAFTRRQISETVRIEHNGVSLLIEEGDDGDAALTAVLSGRTDLVASQNSEVTA